MNKKQKELNMLLDIALDYLDSEKFLKKIGVDKMPEHLVEPYFTQVEKLFHKSWPKLDKDICLNAAIWVIFCEVIQEMKEAGEVDITFEVGKDGKLVELLNFKEDPMGGS